MTALGTELEVLEEGLLEESLDFRLQVLKSARIRPEHAQANAAHPWAWQEIAVSLRAHKAGLATVFNLRAGKPDMPGHGIRTVLESMREERVGTLARFVEYLKSNGVVGGRPKTFEEHHALQKYSYLASMLGAPLHYEFDFLENGAYSSDLALDLYAEARAGSGASPFKKNPRTGEILVRMVAGRGKRTLQAMTFAMRDISEGAERDEFVDTMCRERSLYERRTLEWAFDRVLEARQGLVGKNG
ncbi:MAG: hypothetical protein OXU25_01320 [Thaumarchaeota archaeon]|nr:hypothetical protein [Nitrososphaerota archaeon]